MLFLYCKNKITSGTVKCVVKPDIMLSFINKYSSEMMQKSALTISSGKKAETLLKITYIHLSIEIFDYGITKQRINMEIWMAQILP